MMLIINSLYRNEEVHLREISNASDALDKIGLILLTDKPVLAATEELYTKIKADEENPVLRIVDNGFDRTKQDLGSIAKSGTADPLNRLQDANSTNQFSDLIGQFGVGFYSTILFSTTQPPASLICHQGELRVAKTGKYENPCAISSLLYALLINWDGVLVVGGQVLTLVPTVFLQASLA